MASESQQADLRAELALNRTKEREIDDDLSRALGVLGRHVVNLGIDAGYAEVADRIDRANTMRLNLNDIDADLGWLEELDRDYKHHRDDLEWTEREARVQFDRVADAIDALGEHGLARLDEQSAPDELRQHLSALHELAIADAEASADEAGDGPGAADAREGLQRRGGGIRRATPATRMGWRLLRANSDLSWCSDQELRSEIEEGKKGVVRLLELERHQRYRAEGLESFETELRDVWGFDTVNAMRADLGKQRAEIQAQMEGLHRRVGHIFNFHRLYDRVDDSFVTATRRRIKRYQVRINELKLRRREVLLELRGGEAPE